MYLTSTLLCFSCSVQSEIDVSDIPLPDSMGDPSVVATSEIPMPTDME